VRADHAEKTDLKPWRQQQWVIPPQANAEFVCAMEDVLEVSTRPYDPARPVVCLDEASKQLVEETRVPIPAAPGQPRRVDYEYERRGTANLFLSFEPLAGRRWVDVTERRTAADFAEPHKLAALYQVFPPDEARRLYERFEVHDTPKHGSWLNMAETELSVLSRQCLDRRIGGAAALRREVAAWVEERNRNHCRVDWHFTTTDARTKLKRLYPSFEVG
jgi:hypothetical protein